MNTAENTHKQDRQFYAHHFVLFCSPSLLQQRTRIIILPFRNRPGSHKQLYLCFDVGTLHTSYIYRGTIVHPLDRGNYEPRRSTFYCITESLRYESFAYRWTLHLLIQCSSNSIIRLTTHLFDCHWYPISKSFRDWWGESSLFARTWNQYDLNFDLK